MLSLFIDPFVVAVPSNDNSATFDQYLTSLFLWRDFLNADWLRVYSSANTYHLLHNTGTYPVRPHVERAIAQLDRNDIQVHDVITLINSVLFKTRIIEDEYIIPEAVRQNIKFDPDEHVISRDAAFRDAYIDLLLTIVLVHYLGKNPLQEQVLVTRDLHEDFTTTNVKGEVLWNVDNTSPPIPESVVAAFPSCNTPTGLYLAMEPCSIIRNGGNIEAFNRALTCFLIQHESLQATISLLPSWTIGKDFLGSARKYNFLHDDLRIRMLLRSCAETVRRERMADTHWLRTGAAGGNPQRKRKLDNAKAWRRDIDHEYHLHYWETDEGVEFANVVVHNSFDISE